MSEISSRTGQHALQFGISITPTASTIPLTFKLAQLADEGELDFISIQDHPYNGNFLETWTLLSFLGARTRHVRLLPNVANMALRTPAMLAKAAASLDVLTNGRVELAIGAGVSQENATGYGAPRRTPAELVAALGEDIAIIRAIWQSPLSSGITFNGDFYTLTDAQPGPVPAHVMSIWLGVYGKQMLTLAGQRVDGWIPSSLHMPPEQIPAHLQILLQAAQQAGRRPEVIRRGYNLIGSLQGEKAQKMTARRPGILIGPPELWCEKISSYHHDFGMDTFIFWPTGRDEEGQVLLFINKVVPALKASIQAQ